MGISALPVISESVMLSVKYAAVMLIIPQVINCVLENLTGLIFGL